MEKEIAQESDKFMKIMLVFGTRLETIKMCPLVREPKKEKIKKQDYLLF